MLLLHWSRWRTNSLRNCVDASVLFGEVAAVGFIQPVSPGRERSYRICYGRTERNGVPLTAGSMSVDPCSMEALKKESESSRYSSNFD